MRRHNDEIVECPFDKNHKMPQPRLQWHITNKCKAQQTREEQRLPILHCKHNFMHIYFERDALELHESDCPSKPKPIPKEESKWVKDSPQADWPDDGDIDTIWREMGLHKRKPLVVEEDEKSWAELVDEGFEVEVEMNTFEIDWDERK